MKKNKLLITMFASVVLFFVVTKSKSQGINYEVEYSISTTSNGIYLVTTCNSNSGDACNMPGSIHRSNISAILAAIT
ncbi:hypothetical protein MMU07_12020 [Aquiflexum sp. LQ15W]|uniref:hypothetical protein n=1 Tax=Cognataquiflexum nitidum TaxID=2922272 RepID=UPI001F129E7A|nr:hypothetical protein [Cognataquiflexum nitidum]MCH6200309.1 hypothetical protein [Cognataquiflexum nitidum]